MNTIEGNKLIMFFDGAENSTIDILGNPQDCIKYKDSYYPEWNLPKFNEDWNLLMPVVEKIENLGFQFFIHNDGAYMRKWHWHGNFPDFGNVEQTKIIATYQTVVQFIQWYNKQK